MPDALEDADGLTSTSVENLILKAGDYHMEQLTRINIILGRNGCGKSTALRAVRSGQLVDKTQSVIGTLSPANVQYISPERGGGLQYNASVEHDKTQNPNSIDNDRQRNFVPNFRTQTFARFTDMLFATLEAVEKAYLTKKEGAES